MLTLLVLRIKCINASYVPYNVRFLISSQNVLDPLVIVLLENNMF